MESYKVVMTSTLLYLTIFLILSLHSVEGRMRIVSSVLENMELDRELSLLNKHGVKTIKTIYGDIYDCVDMYKQPAFDHPLLKNHKIQTRPSFAQKEDLPKAKATRASNSSIHTGLDDDCPSGTVPIRRTTKEELLRAKTSFKQHFEDSYSVNEGQPLPKLIFAGLATVQKPATVYHGAAGFVSICNPASGPGQLSASVISVEGGPVESFSTIRVGWMVNVNLFQDSKTRLYTIWGQGIDGVLHGCYNTFCSGFVQTDPKIALGIVLEPVSVVRGPQYYIKLGIKQDKATGNWWLLYGENDAPIGYWSSSLFTHLKDGSEALHWGGMVASSSDQVPVMGNGDNGELHSTHYRQVALEYESGTGLNGTMDVPLEIIKTKCYKAGDNYFKGDFWGYSFYFGGNGGKVDQCL